MLLESFIWLHWRHHCSIYCDMNIFVVDFIIFSCFAQNVTIYTIHWSIRKSENCGVISIENFWITSIRIVTICCLCGKMCFCNLWSEWLCAINRWHQPMPRTYNFYEARNLMSHSLLLLIDMLDTEMLNCWDVFWVAACCVAQCLWGMYPYVRLVCLLWGKQQRWMAVLLARR